MGQRKKKNGGFLKGCTRLAVVAYLLYLSYVYFTYSNSRNAVYDELSSAIRSALSEFEGASQPKLKSRHKNVDTRYASETTKQKKDYNNPLERDFSRIPGYLKGSSNSSLFGYVMRDLSNRFLLPSSAQQKRQHLIRRHLSPSNILVVCPKGKTLLSEIKEKNSTTIASKNELIKSFGYRIGPSFLVESIFNGHNAIGVESNTEIVDDHGSNTTDIMLAIFDPGQGQEDSMLSSQLEEYIRSGTIQFATFPISNSILRTTLLEEWTTKNYNAVIQGIVASKIFFDAGYKLQVLSSSHAPTDGLNPYGPNTLLKNVEEVERFLRFGIGLAQNAEDISPSKNRVYNSTTSSKTKDIQITFHSILFATRSLDLAIPSRKAFLDMTDRGSDFVLDVEKDRVPYLNCPRLSLAATLRFRDDLDSNNDEYNSNGDKIEMSCFGRDISMHETRGKRIDYGNDTIFVELWHSHKNISLSEAACLKCTKITMNSDEENVVERVCTNRIISRKRLPPDLSNQTRKNNRGPNLLAIELRGVTQNMLNSSLAHFALSLGNLGLEYFPNFDPSTTFPIGNGDQKWWAPWNSNEADDDDVYQRYRGSNQCDLAFHGSDNNTMLYHGSQIGGMFCFDYDRPNCLGGKHAATHLFDHVKKFITLNRKENERWASYITLVDGVEETETLVGTLDIPLSNFVSEVKADMSFEEWSDTVFTIFSNDVQKPILFLKANKNEIMLLKEQNTLFTSDLHHIIQSIITPADIGKVFRSDLAPEHVNTIARSVKTGGHNEYRFDEGELVAPPSILSFYADIPKEHKFQLIKPHSERPMKRAMVVQGCRCATNLVSWIQCDRHPWNTVEHNNDKEHYILVDCPGQPIHLEIKVAHNKDLVRRSYNKRKESASTHLNNINIMFLELDSVSLEYADRHFPKTRELLKKYRIKPNDKMEYECIDGICSAEFPYTSLVGANSIPNQVAALSGCITSSTQEHCGFVNPKLGIICNDTDMMHYGFRLERIRRDSKMAFWCPNRDLEITKTPWLFGVSDSKGYINFFGEEFCYTNSPYVTQGAFIRNFGK
jgi:hypothetical protein